jgi:hypothetical protein
MTTISSSFPLHDAAQHGDVRRVEDLLRDSSSSLDINGMDKVRNPISFLYLFSCVGYLSFLLVVEIHSFDLGSSSGHHGIAAILLENGADISNALMFACSKGFREIAFLLIDRGVSIFKTRSLLPSLFL